jgi:methionine aminopeptidase
VLEELGGHGIGRTIHEEPSVPNTPDGAPAAHVEHTIVVTEGAPLVLTR